MAHRFYRGGRGPFHAPHDSGFWQDDFAFPQNELRPGGGRFATGIPRGSPAPFRGDLRARRGVFYQPRGATEPGERGPVPGKPPYNYPYKRGLPVPRGNPRSLASPGNGLPSRGREGSGGKPLPEDPKKKEADQPDSAKTHTGIHREHPGQIKVAIPPEATKEDILKSGPKKDKEPKPGSIEEMLLKAKALKEKFMKAKLSNADTLGAVACSPAAECSESGPVETGLKTTTPLKANVVPPETEPPKVDAKLIGSLKSAPKAGPAKTVPPKADIVKAELQEAGPQQKEPSKVGPPDTTPPKIELLKTGSTRPDPSNSGPPKTGDTGTYPSKKRPLKEDLPNLAKGDLTKVGSNSKPSDGMLSKVESPGATSWRDRLPKGEPLNVWSSKAKLVEAKPSEDARKVEPPKSGFPKTGDTETQPSKKGPLKEDLVKGDLTKVGSNSKPSDGMLSKVESPGATSWRDRLPKGEPLNVLSSKAKPIEVKPSKDDARKVEPPKSGFPKTGDTETQPSKEGPLKEDLVKGDITKVGSNSKPSDGMLSKVESPVVASLRDRLPKEEPLNVLSSKAGPSKFESPNVVLAEARIQIAVPFRVWTLQPLRRCHVPSVHPQESSTYPHAFHRPPSQQGVAMPQLPALLSAPHFMPPRGPPDFPQSVHTRTMGPEMAQSHFNRSPHFQEMPLGHRVPYMPQQFPYRPPPRSPAFPDPPQIPHGPPPCALGFSGPQVPIQVIREPTIPQPGFPISPSELREPGFHQQALCESPVYHQGSPVPYQVPYRQQSREQLTSLPPTTPPATVSAPHYSTHKTYEVSITDNGPLSAAHSVPYMPQTVSCTPQAINYYSAEPVTIQHPPYFSQKDSTVPLATEIASCSAPSNALPLDVQHTSSAATMNQKHCLKPREDDGDIDSFMAKIQKEMQALWPDADNCMKSTSGSLSPSSSGSSRSRSRDLSPSQRYSHSRHSSRSIDRRSRSWSGSRISSGSLRSWSGSPRPSSRPRRSWSGSPRSRSRPRRSRCGSPRPRSRPRRSRCGSPRPRSRPRRSRCGSPRPRSRPRRSSFDSPQSRVSSPRSSAHPLDSKSRPLRPRVRSRSISPRLRDSRPLKPKRSISRSSHSTERSAAKKARIASKVCVPAISQLTDHSSKLRNTSSMKQKQSLLGSSKSVDLSKLNINQSRASAREPPKVQLPAPLSDPRNHSNMMNIEPSLSCKDNEYSTLHNKGTFCEKSVDPQHSLLNTIQQQVHSSNSKKVSSLKPNQPLHTSEKPANSPREWIHSLLANSSSSSSMSPITSHFPISVKPDVVSRRSSEDSSQPPLKKICMHSSQTARPISFKNTSWQPRLPAAAGSMEDYSQTLQSSLSQSPPELIKSSGWRDRCKNLP
ncbi:serine/arginine repetitive matrix protein 2-like [Ambystoma mexicanum]|uniref:serine/arginine repetitive matrix protein 2-like n=1 Tax=Ambystoma mexicanum TaxID=8296 RepID=UPI0037E7C858